MMVLMPEKLHRRVFFINEASASIGMGHLLRSQVLARAMYLRGYDILGITIGDDRAVTYAEERAKLEEFKWPILTMQNTQAAIDYILHNAMPMMVVDCNEASSDIVRAGANSGVDAVALDYFLSEQPLPAAVINLIDHNPDTLAGHPPIREGVAYYEGPQYAIIRNEFLKARERRVCRGERTSVRNILIAFGGADPSGNTRRALEMILQWPGEFIVNLIIGPLFASEMEQVADIVSNKCLVRVHSSPNNMGELFEDADLVFCGGGGTLLEAMCVGVPAIVIAQNAPELRHANSLALRNACWLSDHVDWELVRSVENREKRSKCAQGCVDGQGAERICDVIEQQLKRE